jgi:hypothetical protein
VWREEVGRRPKLRRKREKGSKEKEKGKVFSFHPENEKNCRKIELISRKN